MARILHGWEFGGGLGHLTTALPLAGAYRARNHEVAFAVKDVAAAGVVIPAEQYPVYQAPLWHPPPESAVGRPISYAEILLGHGFGDSERLASLVRAWLRLFDLIEPDLLVLDFSPTAMLAAHIAGVRHCAIGSGFFIPPSSTPVAAFIAQADRQRLHRSEQSILTAINQMRAKFGVAPLACFGALFDVPRNLLTTWQEIDHYPQRDNARYWGPVLMRNGGKPPDFSRDGARRLFVYLAGHYSKLTLVLQAIESTGVDALIYCPGAPEKLLQHFSSGRIKLSRELYTSNEVMSEADALLCHGNFGLVCEALLAGKPVLCLPLQMEQYILTQRLVELGAAIQPDSQPTLPWLMHAITAVLTQPGYTRAAESFARKYRRHDPAVQLEQMVDVSTAVL